MFRSYRTRFGWGLVVFHLFVIFAHAGQPYGCGGCSCPAGDHSQHASLCGFSVRQPIGAAASDGVCTDGKHRTRLETSQDRCTVNTGTHKLTLTKAAKSRINCKTHTVTMTNSTAHWASSGSHVHKSLVWLTGSCISVTIIWSIWQAYALTSVRSVM